MTLNQSSSKSTPTNRWMSDHFKEPLKIIEVFTLELIEYDLGDDSDFSRKLRTNAKKNILPTLFDLIV
jgi:hypothetical protein